MDLLPNGRPTFTESEKKAIYAWDTACRTLKVLRVQIKDDEEYLQMMRLEITYNMPAYGEDSNGQRNKETE